MEEEELTVNLPLLLVILFSAFASKWLHTVSPGFCQWVLKKPPSAVQLRTELASLKEELQKISITYGGNTKLRSPRPKANLSMDRFQYLRYWKWYTHWMKSGDETTSFPTPYLGSFLHLSSCHLLCGDSFAEHARLQRRITQKQRQLEDHEKKSSSAHLRRVVLLQGVCFVLIEGTRIGIIVSHRHDPVVQLPPHHLWPLSWVLAFPTGIPGVIGAPCWGLLSRQVTETVLSLWSSNKT